MSKKHASVETSSYGSEFTTVKHCCEYLRGIRNKLRIMGIPCEFPSFMYGDNKHVLVNSPVPHSTRKKKSCSISDHFIEKGLQMMNGELLVLSLIMIDHIFYQNSFQVA